MSDDPAVQAAIEARRQHWVDAVTGQHLECVCGAQLALSGEWVDHETAIQVEAARLVWEADARLEAAVVAREAAAAEAEAYRRGCDDTAAELIALSRAAVRTEPEK